MARTKPPHWSPRFFDPHIPKLPSIYKAPVFGKWARRIGQVEFMLAEACTDDPLLWIEGFFFNVPKFIWSFVSPDLNDSYFNRVGRKHGGKRGFTFNLEGLIEGESTDVELPGYARFLFRLGELAQQVGFWFMVVDATSDFLVNWVSTVYQWAGCNAGLGSWVKGTCEGEVITPFGPPIPLLIGAHIEGDGRLILPGGGGLYAPTGKAFGVGCNIKTSQFSSFPPIGHVFATIQNSSGKILSKTGEIKINPDTQQGSATMFARFPENNLSGEFYRAWLECQGGMADLTGSSMWLQALPDQSFGPGFGQTVNPRELPWAHP